MANKVKGDHIFLWEGIDKNGMRATGEQQAFDRQSAKLILQQADITLLKIKKKPTSVLLAFKNKIHPEDISAFTRELSTLISANIPLTSALEITEANASKSSFKKLIANIRQKVTSGQSFAHTLKSHAPYFDDLFCSLVEAGEHSGTLNVMLRNIAEHHEKSAQLRRTIKKALFYPLTVLVISLLVTAALLIFIVPQFADLFKNVGAELPLLTQIIINLSDNIYNHGKALSAVIFLLIILIKIQSKHSSAFQFFLDKLTLHIPVFGRILKQSILAKCFATFAVLLRAGIPLTEALQLVGKISTNRIYQVAFADVLSKVIAGHAIHQAIADTKRFPESAAQLIAIGEASGTLDDMLKNLGEHFQERVDNITHNLSQLLEPAIMIFLSLVVGTVVIAMYLPIFKLGTVI